MADVWPRPPARYSLSTMPLLLVALLLVAAGLPACTLRTTPAASTSGNPPGSRAAPAARGDVAAELDKRILHIFQAKDSAYWFGSDGQGVYRYDGKELLRFTTEQGLTSDRVRGIQEDRSGNIFVCGEPGGVSRFDGRGFSRLTALDSSKSEWKLGPDDLWFPGGQDSGVVYRWDGASLHRLAFPKTEAGEAHIAAHPRSKYPNAKYSPYDVYTIFKDSKGRVWFGTSNLGTCRYDGSSFVWAGTGENGSFGVRSIVEDTEGRFWLSNTVHRFAEDPSATAGSGVARYRQEPGIATDVDPYSVFMSTVRDRDGVLWMATLGNGVFRYDGTTWTRFPVTDEDKPIRVFSIYRDRQDVLWLGTHEHGVYKFNGRTFKRFNP
jgi:ligand-binding sensor domain-containing protein